MTGRGWSVKSKTSNVGCEEVIVSPFTSHVSFLLREFFDEVAEFGEDQFFHRQADGVF